MGLQSDSTKRTNLIHVGVQELASFFHNDSAKQANHFVHENHKLTKGGEKYPYNVKEGDSLAVSKSFKLDSNKHLAYEVLGWYPYWEKSFYEDMSFSMVTTVAYFAYELNPKTGEPISIHDWRTTAMIDSAVRSGNSVLLTVTNFGEKNNKDFLSNSAAQVELISNLLKLLKLRKANGVCIDFEGVSKSQKDVYSNFVKQLSRKLKASNKKYQVYITMPCVDWANSLDFSTLNPEVDRFILMGYSYYGSFSKVAGPVSPNKSGKIWEPYNLTNSIDTYLKDGVPAKKLILALGYFGAVWETVADDKGAKVKSYVGSRTYDYIRTQIKSPSQYDDVSQTVWQSYVTSIEKSEIYRQCWYDNDSTLGLKMDLIKRKGLAGMGIWALGYDKGYSEMWEMIANKMSAEGSSIKDSSGTEEADKSDSNSVEISFLDKLDQFEVALAGLVRYKVTLAVLLFFVVLFGGSGVIIAMFVPSNRDFFFGSTGRILLFAVVFLIVSLILLRLIGFLADMQVAVVVGFITGVIALILFNKIFVRINGDKP
ncbi:glycosyl hydrolase family 18 protein [Xanthomarina gelatinilytica]|uniref:glycosyl hydrolase family 18 protein n=1 Tax=Xanthomarina gelatinilytica TaxID=1137281 RepID=UPI003AA8D02F